MNKLIYAIMILIILGMTVAAPARDISPMPDWSGYDELIRQIKSENDFGKRAELMHQAEDMLMETGAVIPLFYYNDAYLQSSKVSGIYGAIDASKFFYYAQKEGDNTLRINIGPEPDFLDPALGTSMEKGLLTSNSFSGLYEYNAEGEMAPVLAEGCTISDDGLTYTFTLKDGLKWSDGSDLTAEDFVYSWKRAADPKTGCEYSYMLDVIAGYEEAQAGNPDALQVSAPDAKTETLSIIDAILLKSLILFKTRRLSCSEKISSRERLLSSSDPCLQTGQYRTCAFSASLSRSREASEYDIEAAPSGFD